MSLIHVLLAGSVLLLTGAMAAEAASADDASLGQGRTPVLREIYFAGGCFWGVQEHFSRIPGVAETQAGYANGFNLKLTVPSNYSIYMNMAEVLVEQLSQIGIKLTIEPVEWSTWLSDVYTARNFESTIIGFDASTLSAGAMLNRWMSTDASNMISYSDPTYDELMTKAMASTDDEEQTDLYKQAAARLNETAANIYIEDMADFVVMKQNVAGYQFYPLYVMDLSKVYFTAE